MRAFVLAIMLALLAGVVPPTSTEALSFEQTREKEKWGCSWRSDGFRKEEENTRTGWASYWWGRAIVRRCKDREEDDYVPWDEVKADLGLA